MRPMRPLPGRRTARRIASAVAASALSVALVAALSACTSGPNVDESKTLHVVAGSEVKDLQPLLDQMEQETGVHLDMTYMGTLEGAEELASGALDGQADATWFPSNRYLSLLDGGQGKIARETKIMYSPVVLGLKQDRAQALGWTQTSPTWDQIVQAVSEGRLTYGMTSPVTSNSGFSTLIEAATALSGTGDALTDAAIATATPELVALSAGQDLTSGSSGWLADRFAEDPTVVDGIFNYESVLRGMSVDGQPLAIVTPSDGVITADYPFTLLSGASDEKSALYDQAVAWLTSDDAQRSIAETTHRNTATNPVNSSVVFELPFPSRLETVQALISAYLSDIKKPSQMVFTIDLSGSMEGDRIEQLRAALKTMTSSDPADSFLAFRNRETVRYVTFSDDVLDQREFTFTENGRDAELERVGRYIDGMQTVSGTAIYTALQTSYEDALTARRADPDSFVSVVLFTDGENNGDLSFDDFRRWYESERGRDSGIQTIPTFVVQFGDSNAGEMQDIADLTGGRVFDGTGQSLASAFAEIRGYQ
jgi:Ca-activated chloride channel homolog